MKKVMGKRGKNQKKEQQSTQQPSAVTAPAKSAVVVDAKDGTEPKIEMLLETTDVKADIDSDQVEMPLTPRPGFFSSDSVDADHRSHSASSASESGGIWRDVEPEHEEGKGFGSGSPIRTDRSASAAPVAAFAGSYTPSYATATSVCEGVVYPAPQALSKRPVCEGVLGVVEQGQQPSPLTRLLALLVLPLSLLPPLLSLLDLLLLILRDLSAAHVPSVASVASRVQGLVSSCAVAVYGGFSWAVSVYLWLLWLPMGVALSALGLAWQCGLLLLSVALCGGEAERRRVASVGAL
ncbi:hypothetical protein B484DRAFT_449918 [Ochromonadaceae sp. CCMP2298]|nr:hypothetical protein B484DRAFT_449918 [Ochromonadaceae sp. CCMP2298]|mmetsp:Transcript_13970/g.30857  ORF Transcript_13970/g.30857 Transcript_13970/m.30857 type:complete len:294 (-) Transcript_13970:200-1081(-)|eukprot:CAMPEP_0173247284 /NCGR_PEP_ID=MMETSP1142-20121109/17807_1 /TAXON_ID=483371 /ORGANISM="non described non described, Strain CCMP2298" /LENGTH=293 /DNA_ID=CAMNT_0014179641 /DNA_START=1 /DNA_END=882 /DNA_ORIENTATION=-